MTHQIGQSGSTALTDHGLHSNAVRGNEAQVASRFTTAQSDAILIASIVCASISLVAVLLALRWFLIMKRNFRHLLVMILVISDMMKALCYFIFPLVNIARQPIISGSAWCQASGFMLHFSIEAADVSILIIALHSILYVMRPALSGREGGLYQYRYWICPVWLGFPILAASLAFINPDHPYAGAGTFCYLPKRPIWYRLVLSWIPRYIIIGVILCMYVWVYIYVYLKFRTFDRLHRSDSYFGSEADSRRKSSAPTRRSTDPDTSSPPPSKDFGSQAIGSPGPPVIGSPRPQHWRTSSQGWGDVDYIATKPLETVDESVAETEAATGTRGHGSAWSGETHIPPLETLSMMHARGGSGSDKPSVVSYEPVKRNDAVDGAEKQPNLDEDVHVGLRKTRIAIRRQLGYLFVYPLVYLVMWSLPFVSYVLSYLDHFLYHPIFGLSIVQTCMLALQAGVDCALFSWTEKPWKRVDKNSPFAMSSIRRRSIDFFRRRSSGSDVPPEATAQEAPRASKSNPHWWEAEGHRRNDSVWLGTSSFLETLSQTMSVGRSARNSLRPGSPEKPNESADPAGERLDSGSDLGEPGTGTTTPVPAAARTGLWEPPPPINPTTSGRGSWFSEKKRSPSEPSNNT